MYIYARNKLIYRNYEVLEKYIAGIVLRGHEVKAIRTGLANLSGNYVRVINDELYVVNMHIGWYKFSQFDIQNHLKEKIQIRNRKLLLHKQEIAKIKQKVTTSGLTAIILDIGDQHNKIKVTLAIVKGLKKYDKRQKLKEKYSRKTIKKTFQTF